MRFCLVFFLLLNVSQSSAASEKSSDSISPDEVQIAQAIDSFFVASGSRDLLRLRGTVDQSLLIVEAGSKPDVHLFHSPNVAHLLPPDGNDDLKSMTIDRITANISATNPTVAMATFRMKHAISDSRQESLESMLETSHELPLDARLQIQGVLHGWEMFAMLVKKDGAWKVVALTVPK